MSPKPLTYLYIDPLKKKSTDYKSIYIQWMLSLNSLWNAAFHFGRPFLKTS